MINTFMMNNSELGALDKPRLINLALDASDELQRLARSGQPLWNRSVDGDGEMMNIKEYDSSFIPIIRMKPEHFTTKATRASCIVAQNCLTLVETLMDKIFPCIVGKACTIDVISNGLGENKSAVLLLIKTELQLISDLVPVWEIKFLRYCKKHVDGLWVVVDVSVDTIQQGSQQCEIQNCRRLPFGCVVQDMFNGYSQVIQLQLSFHFTSCPSATSSIAPATSQILEKPSSEPTPLRRSPRVRKQNPRYANSTSCTFFLLVSDPTFFEDAEKEDKWSKAIEEESMAIQKNQTWDLVNLTKGNKAIGIKWVFRTKYHVDGDIQKQKARLVANGYSQQQGIDSDNTFCPFTLFKTMRTFLALAANLN
ncbi:hypothetical protein MTR67_042868 [Solanum verrucosum]|uniref:START domain-containing protein n=1 Tax=Solanum verrucosum TaxID=315347 RepID=A0AAF0UQ87_SOLVR|nr:hypothetical protein MTR67_042868 [Solanum verrucosum]